ncbi:MAG: transporter substrate-binding domain-containing protein [Nitrospinaceae bacterium]|nr:transporter substrate-binding domain-containing protein [Nitrospinaceae bacterium]
MRRRLTLLFLAFFTFVIAFTAPVRPAEATPAAQRAKPAISLSESEREWLREHPILKLAPDPDFPPIEYLDGSGVYRGIAADYVTRLEKILGVRFTIVPLKTWPEVLKRAKSREIDLFGAATFSPQRAAYMRFTRPHIELPGVIITRKETGGAIGLDNILDMRVAIVEGYIWQDLLKNKYPSFKPHLVPNISAGLKAVSFGRVDVFINDPATSTFYIEKEGITNLRVAGETGMFTRLAIAVRKDWPELRDILDKGLAAIGPDEKREILRKWVNLGTEPWQISTEHMVQMAMITVFFVILAILFWNRTLHRRVEIRTRELLEAKDEEERSRQVFDRVFYDNVIPMIMAAPDQTITRWNPAAQALYGYAEDEVVGRNVHLLILDDNKDEMDFGLDIRQKNAPGSMQTVHLKKDGTSVPVEITLSPIHGPEGEIIAVAGIHKDLTESLRVDRMKSEFISTVSHELRTPLTSITGALGLLKSGVLGPMPEETAHMVTIAHGNSERLVRLINDILDMDKIESGKMDFKMGRVELSGLIERSLEETRAYGEQYGVSFDFQKITVGAWVRGDADRLLQVLVNLISNGAKFSPEGGRVEVALSENESGYRVEIADHGPGVPEEFQDKIFEKFTQADATDHRQKGGTGLGLSICKAIIEQHGGQIGFGPTPGGGATFHFTLGGYEDTEVETIDRR